MSIWEDFSVEARVRCILDVPSRKPGHHFGRPFEPRRVCRRLQLLRGWSYDEENIGKIFT